MVGAEHDEFVRTPKCPSSLPVRAAACHVRMCTQGILRLKRKRPSTASDACVLDSADASAPTFRRKSSLNDVYQSRAVGTIAC